MLNKRGDTIVEVLIALAVLSLAFAISYTTANHALEISQTTQEHSLALEYLDKQAEMLWYLANNYQNSPTLQTVEQQTFSSNGDFCLQTNDTNPSSITYQINNCSITASGFNYSIWIKRQNNNFQITIQWPGLGQLGTQNEQLSYRVYPS